jgi:hypothetical protein
MTNNSYQDNSRVFLPYASCNINTADGCMLDLQCTFSSNCLQMVTADYRQMQQVAEATRDRQDFKCELLTPQQAYDKLIAESHIHSSLLSKSEAEIVCGIRPHMPKTREQYEQDLQIVEDWVARRFARETRESIAEIFDVPLNTLGLPE